jgi:hypothetical protein
MSRLKNILDKNRVTQAPLSKDDGVLQRPSLIGGEILNVI